MKAAIYNPYWDTLGGGELYTLSFSKVLQEIGYRVDIQWSDPNILTQLSKRFGIETSGLNIVKQIKNGDGYDVCFWLSDGSIPLLRARINILHFQFPFRNVNGNSLMNRMKLYRINKVICNSKFTKKFIDKEFRTTSEVLYPPVRMSDIHSKRKENSIIYVGRFSNLTQKKNQHVLIKLFIKLYQKGYKQWKLVLAGGTEIGSDKYLQTIQKIAKGFPVEIIKSPDRKILLELYGKSKIFWSAAGYGVDELINPLNVEHFGISLVEAMAAGVVPLVYNSGGYKEIISEGYSGYLWRDSKELIKKTTNLVENNKQLIKISKNAKRESKKYSYEIFRENTFKILDR